jgi:hypothetical protein
MRDKARTERYTFDRLEIYLVKLDGGECSRYAPILSVKMNKRHAIKTRIKSLKSRARKAAS